MTPSNKQVTRPPAATGSGSESNSQQITSMEMSSMSVQQSTGLAEWYARVEAAKSAGTTSGAGRHAHRPVIDTTIEPTPALAVDPFGHVQVGDPDPSPDWFASDASLCNALSPTVIPVPSDHGEEFTLRYACTRFPHPAHWQHIAVDAVMGVIEVWHGDESLEDTTVLAIADDLVDEHQDDAVDGWPTAEDDEDDDLVELSSANHVRRRALNAEQREGLAAVLEVYGALCELGTALDIPQPLVDALANAEAVLSPRAGA